MSSPSIILDCIAAAKDIIVAVAAVATAGFAFAGLNKWRAELRGRADFDAARDIARAMYKFREALQGARSAFMSHAEFPEGYSPGVGSRNPKEDADALAHAYRNRWSPVWEAAQELNIATLEGEALWGSDIRKRMEALRLCAAEFRVAFQQRIEDTARGGHVARTNPKHDEAINARLWTEWGEGKNQLDDKIEVAIRGLEEIIRPHLARWR